MRRWLLLVSVVIVVIVLTTIDPRYVWKYVWKTETMKKRDAAYQSALQAYSQNLQPGLTRREVENYLRVRDISFGQMCCVDERSAFADLVKVGQEDAPWYCSEYYVYVAFEFVAAESHPRWGTFLWDSRARANLDDSDVLKKVRIFRKLGGCL